MIGDTRFSYDVWGDAVNVASRMESHGVAGRIQVSEAFRDADRRCVRVRGTRRDGDQGDRRDADVFSDRRALTKLKKGDLAAALGSSSSVRSVDRTRSRMVATHSVRSSPLASRLAIRVIPRKRASKPRTAVPAFAGRRMSSTTSVDSVETKRLPHGRPPDPGGSFTPPRPPAAGRRPSWLRGPRRSPDRRPSSRGGSCRDRRSRAA